MPLLLEGAGMTLKVTVLSSATALLLSITAGLGSSSRAAVVRWISRLYIQLFRAVSLLILLFWMYFALPFAGIEMSKLTAAVLAIALNMGAYGAEIVRSAVAAVPQGQHEASIALNLTAHQKMRRIIIPQAVTRMLPPIGNLLIELLKSTSLIYYITLSDLTYEAMIIRNNYYS
ncbi:Inner membrane amino-acid ABC transporter permease protein YecS [compost metagenome]